MYKLILFLSVIISSSVAQDICPPASVVEPCRCDKGADYISYHCFGTPRGTNLREIFDRVVPYYEDSYVITALYISNTDLTEFPADTIPVLKFKHINFGGNRNMTYISPLAFNATYAVTEKLFVVSNGITDESDIWAFFNKFINTELIDLAYQKGVTTIPERAFGSLPNVKRILLSSNGISSIGSLAFSQLPALEFLGLGFNNISSQSNDISPTAFTMNTTRARISPTRNYELLFVNETIYKSVLDFGNTLDVGDDCNSEHCPKKYLVCDWRADWICENAEKYINLLFGFRCEKDGPYATVWDYCARPTNL